MPQPVTWTDKLVVLCLGMVLIGLSLSKVLISIGTIGIVVIWLGAWIRGSIKPWIFFNYPGARNLALYFLLLLVGMLWSENQTYGWNDLKIKLPLLFLPICLPAFLPHISKQIRQKLENLFVISVVLSTLVTLFLFTFFPEGDIPFLPKKIRPNHIRDFSLFTSHIRMGLFIALSFAILITRKPSGTFTKWIKWSVLAYLMYFLIFTESFTGFFAVGVVVVYYLWRYLHLHVPLGKRWVIGGGLAVLIVMLVVYLIQGYRDYIAPKANQPIALSTTVSGNAMDGFPGGEQRENGYLVYHNICWKELEIHWNKHSSLPFNGKDKSGSPLAHTLARYLSSMGLNKDSTGVAHLTSQDVHNIECGIPNIQYPQMNGLQRRLNRIYFEYNMFTLGSAPNGHSLFQRFIYWQNAWTLFKEHPFLGVGTGDVADQIHLLFQANDHGLLPEFQLRTHNQYLTFLITLGILGFLPFMWVIYSMMKAAKRFSITALLFVWIAALSCLTEDTLETQAGVTFIAFFTAWWLGAPVWTSEKWRPDAD